MAMPAQLACHIAQDLIVAYVLGDLRPETAAWVSEHLQSCPSCQEAVRQAQEAAGGVKRAAPPPPADAGRNLVGRVRRRVRLLVTVVVGCLLLTGVTGIYLWRNPEVYAGLTGLITDMGVPGADTTPREV
ncbi:MAG TPA: zf-HC2 domain-containing protein, partial [Symbiobacteriaceae bacterium]|nr:zf-HC2 domain-containing protein [Symbiobacteriaceae bacterium]